MRPTELEILLEGIAAPLIGCPPITDVVIDSRDVTPGCLYVAIVGDKYNGNDFAREALEKGAVAAVVSSSTGCENEILVSDTRVALASMAGNYRRLFPARLIGVTGSVGKTTTKEMTGAILSQTGETLITQGNFNNTIGVPKTLFRLDEKHVQGVLEICQDGLGAISRLSKAVSPCVGVITCIGVSHMEVLGSRENILKAKLEIADGLTDGGVLVYSADDDMLPSAVPLLGIKTVGFGIESRQATVRAQEISSRGNATFFTLLDADNGSFETEIPAVGRHSVLNALAAYTAATRFGIDPQLAVKGLLNYTPVGMRQHIVDFQGITVIEDCYNASPESMKASLGILSDIVKSGVKIAVLGDMLELGSISDDAHREIGLECARQGIDVVLCFGKNARIIAESAKAAGVTVVRHFDDRLELAEYLKNTAHEGDGIMFKASQAMDFKKIIESFYRLETQEDDVCSAQ